MYARDAILTSINTQLITY